MIFRWIGEGIDGGIRVSFFSIRNNNVDLIFSFLEIFSEDDKYPFVIKRVNKNENLINITEEIYEDVVDVSLIITNNLFKETYRHYYNLMMFTTKNFKIKIGVLSDSLSKKPTKKDFYYILTTDFINIVGADYKKVNSYKDLMGTPFESLSCVFDKVQLARELLKNE